MTRLLFVLLALQDVDTLQMSDVERFPHTIGYIGIRLEMARTQMKIANLTPTWEAAMFAQARWEAACWQALGEAKGKDFGGAWVPCRLLNLAQLKLLLGRDNYQLGRMP